jgi:hypothetical protein
VFLTQVHPKQTQGSDVHAGTSLDQIYAQKFGQDTPIPSMQMCIENVDQAGGCSYGYSCTYTDSISWASPERPLPMTRDPRTVFDQLFGVGATPQERAERRSEDRSILDWLSTATARLKKGARRRRPRAPRLVSRRGAEIERRIQKVEAHNTSGEARELPEAPIGVPDSFSEHVKLMLDLQALAFASDITRVFAFKLGRDASNRVYPRADSRARSTPRRITASARIAFSTSRRSTRITSAWFPYLAEKLKNTPDGDGNLLDNSLIIYGSPMGDSNLHNHKRCPLFLVGHAGGRLKGGLHLRAADGTPMANVMLSVLQALGIDDSRQFGDSTSAFDLNGGGARPRDVIRCGPA